MLDKKCNRTKTYDRMGKMMPERWKFCIRHKSPLFSSAFMVFYAVNLISACFIKRKNISLYIKSLRCMGLYRTNDFEEWEMYDYLPQLIKVNT